MVEGLAREKDVIAQLTSAPVIIRRGALGTSEIDRWDTVGVASMLGMGVYVWGATYEAGTILRSVR